MKLYSYWRSGAAYRLRIALELKGIDYETVPVNLLKGEHRSEEYLSLNPLGLVPALSLDNCTALTQSLAILDWIDREYPTPPLLPSDSILRAKALAAGMTIAVDTHPIQNVGVVNHLKSDFRTDDQGGIKWMCHWMERGFLAFQKLCRPDTYFAFGDVPGYADICLVPQLYNARRWGMDLTPYRILTTIETHCMMLPAFDAARPENQPDAN
ncbi:MAG: maleylacetoacetate isomerase [Sulfitobacter sp.]